MAPLDRPLNVGFLGAGYIADWHAKAVRTVPGAKLAAICDRDHGRAQALAARSRGARVYTSLTTMLAECQLDLVHVLLPPDRHAETAGEIIDARVHVLLEKPMATRVEHCIELIERARSKQVKIGVGHNFLFAPIYERLRDDLKAGRLGRPDEITITWNKGLDQLQAGPFDLWMLRSAENIILEIGPHSVAQMIDLTGLVEIAGVHVANPIELPSGQQFFRRWRVEAGHSFPAVTLRFSFAPGFSEHSIHVRGSLGSAIADFERNTYILRRHTKFGLDYDCYRMTMAEARELNCQARRTFGQVILSKLRPSGGNPYGQSIARAIQSFYSSLADRTDSRLAPELGLEVVRTCVDIGRRASLGTPLARSIPASPFGGTTQGKTHRQPSTQAEILVLGATGFIGQELARQLVAHGYPIRALVRNPGRFPADLAGGQIEVVSGNLENGTDLKRALAGIQFVYHLAKPLAKYWEEYAEHEVEATRKVAEACLEAKVKRLIYTGTIDSYYAGAKATTITEETPLDPQIQRRNYYARSKALSEQLLMALHRDKGLPVVIFRPGIVIGRGGSPFHWGVGMWSWNAVCQIWGRGHNALPFVLVEDVAEALVTALHAEAIDGDSFNLIADAQLSALDYLNALEQCTAVEFQKLPTAPWKFYLVDVLKSIIKRAIRHPDRRWPSYRDWETRTQRANYDCSKARRVLNWKPVSDEHELIRSGINRPAFESLA
jgi:nucleoside-diphosphate-sugar epimerase/predicted dehydrogenase